MTLPRVTVRAQLTQRLHDWFPDREFILRSEGKLRFIKLSTKMQVAATGVLALVAGTTLASVTGAAIAYSSAQSERVALAVEATELAKAESRIGAVERGLAENSAEIERRVEFMERLLPMLPDDVAGELTGSAAATAAFAPAKGEGALETDPKLSRLSVTQPEAARLLKLEQRQLALTARLTAFANERASSAEATLRKLGLNPRAILATKQDAMGGPLEELATGADGKIDPRLERLGNALARMEALERGLASLPQVVPVSMQNVSSGFGYRRDPFVGRAAMHSGLDFHGRTGDPIHAASGGRVSFVGYKGGYGNTVEITHGNGLLTRYAHMSAFKARKGQTVAAGEVIGAMGSTGRSTGPHLHFEVRINDRAVNPRPFLEAAPNVVEQARTDRSSGAKPHV